MRVALIHAAAGAAQQRGIFARDIDARAWIDSVETLIDPAAVAAGEFRTEPIEVDYPHVVISLEIQNAYELYGDVTTHADNIVIPVPPREEDEEAYDDWFQNNIVVWSGVGNEDGDSWYDFEVTASSDEGIIPVGHTYDWGY